MLKIIATAAVAFATGVVAKMSYDKFQNRKSDIIIDEVATGVKDALLDATAEAKKVAAAEKRAATKAAKLKEAKKVAKQAISKASVTSKAAPKKVVAKAPAKRAAKA